MPSSSEAVESPPRWPMMGRSRRLTLVVRSPRSVQVSPRLVLFQSLLVPAYKVLASCGDMINGASQLAGAMAFPSSGSGRPGPQASQLRRSEMAPRGSPGRMSFTSWVTRSTRVRPRYCDSAYTVRLVVVSTRLWNPSPPPIWCQSSNRMLPFTQLALGPIQLPLSWRPPYTQYGRRLSTAIRYHWLTGRLVTYSQVAALSYEMPSPPSSPLIRCRESRGFTHRMRSSLWSVWGADVKVFPPSSEQL